MEGPDPQEWIVLDNLKHGWPLATNLPFSLALPAYERCRLKGWVVEKRITAAGDRVRSQYTPKSLEERNRE